MPAPSAPLIVIDLQTDMFESRYMPPIHQADTLVARTRALLNWARTSGRKVAFVQHAGPPGDPLAPGLPGHPVWPALGQAEGEPTFGKTVGDAFSNADLTAWVGDAGEVILLGAQTEECIAASVKGALARGLKVTVVGDAHSTWDSDGRTADQIIASHNAQFSEAGAEVIETQALTTA